MASTKPLPARAKAAALKALAEEMNLDRARERLPKLTGAQWRQIFLEAAQAMAANPEAGVKDEPAPAKPAQPDLIPEPNLKAKQQAKAVESGEAVGVLFTDGASRGNPGPAGAGAALYLGELKVGQAYRKLGRMTNNRAEYEALLMGLELAREKGFRRIQIRADSELMVRQIEGRYKVKNQDLKPLYQSAMALLNRFDSYSIIHIERALNKEADSLANLALDS